MKKSTKADWERDYDFLISQWSSIRHSAPNSINAIREFIRFKINFHIYKDRATLKKRVKKELTFASKRQGSEYAEGYNEARKDFIALLGGE